MLEAIIHRFPPSEYQVKEAFNTLSANLSFIGRDIKKILITSCRPAEGKSSISMNLMRTMSSIGLKVVLVDADIRASELLGRYDIQIVTPDKEKYLGLSRYLAGHGSVEDILVSTNIPGAHMILSGTNVINSMPLLTSKRLDQLMETLNQQFDIVLVDAPPVGTIIDAATIARCCDGTLFVVKSGLLPRRELLEAMRQLERAGSPILGTVLNEFDGRKYGMGYYYHKNYYQYEDNAKKNAKQLLISDKSNATKKRKARRIK